MAVIIKAAILSHFRPRHLARTRASV